MYYALAVHGVQFSNYELLYRLRTYTCLYRRHLGAVVLTVGSVLTWDDHKLHIFLLTVESADSDNGQYKLRNLGLSHVGSILQRPPCAYIDSLYNYTNFI